MLTSTRRRLAAGAMVLLVPVLGACGFNEQTDQVYQPSVGVDNRSGNVDILGAVVVSSVNGEGTFVASLVNNNQREEDTLVSMTGDGLEVSLAAPVKVPAGDLVDLADTGAVSVTGDTVQSGGFARLTLTFESGQKTQINAPVVPYSGVFNDVRLATPKSTPRSLTGMSDAPRTLILLRHGESDWNAKNLFTGWVDVPLTEKGRAEAVSGGEQLVEAGLLPDVVHTSLLRRAITTAHLSLDAADRHWIPVRRSWRLNERHYGALQGKDKKQTLEEYGEEQFMTWRRSFDVPPPPIEDDDEWSQAGDVRYADLGDELPRTECLKDVIERLLPYWESAIVPDLVGGDTVLIAAHGNSLRAIVKHLDDISDEDIAGLNIPTGQPLVYELDAEMRPIERGGRYLDPEAAAAAAEAVANQGR